MGDKEDLISIGNTPFTSYVLTNELWRAYREIYGW